MTTTGRAEESLCRRRIAVLAQHGVNKVAVAVDRPVRRFPATANPQIGLVSVPVPTTETALAVPASAEFAGQHRRELRLQASDGVVAGDDSEQEKHPRQVMQGQAVAQLPPHNTGGDYWRGNGRRSPVRRCAR